jgi:hypothetical protein
LPAWKDRFAALSPRSSVMTRARMWWPACSPWLLSVLGWQAQREQLVKACLDSGGAWTGRLRPPAHPPDPAARPAPFVRARCSIAPRLPRRGMPLAVNFPSLIEYSLVATFCWISPDAAVASFMNENCRVCDSESNLDHQLQRPVGLSRCGCDQAGIPRIAELAVVIEAAPSHHLLQLPVAAARRHAAIEPPGADQTPSGRGLYG